MVQNPAYYNRGTALSIVVGSVGQQCWHVHAGAATCRGKWLGWGDQGIAAGPQLVHAHLHHSHALRLHRASEVILNHLPT